MCDPLTLAVGTGSVLSSVLGRKNSPPPARIPAPPVQEAKQDTGATVALGDERTETEEDRIRKQGGETTTKRAGSTVRSTGRSGINIL